jgi:arginyl-tRNA synthetase
MKDQLRGAILQALKAAQDAGDLPAMEEAAPDFVIEKPRSSDHGDLAANLAMQLARPCRKKPRDIAEALVKHLGEAGGLVAKAEIAGPGFINFFLKPSAWLSVLPCHHGPGGRIRPLGLGQGPQGDGGVCQRQSHRPVARGPRPGRGAGRRLGRLLAYTGGQVAREYYINDAGNQMATLGRSVLHRAKELKGSNEPFPDNHYRGEYIKDLAEEYLATPQGQDALDQPEAEAVNQAAAWAGDKILDRHQGRPGPLGWT